MKEYYCRFNLYNSARKRVSIFAQLIGDQLEIVVFPCSRQDRFSKKRAREIYSDILAGVPQPNGEEYNYEVFRIPAQEKPLRTFLDWSFNNYRSRVLKSFKVVELYETVSPAVAKRMREEFYAQKQTKVEFKEMEVAIG